VTWNSDTNLTIKVSVSSSATVGPRNVTVKNPDGGTATMNGGFTVT
jgi:hypothetical protein